MTTKGAKLAYDTFVEVEWVDAVSNEAWSASSDDMSPSTMVTRGWLIKETDTYIVLANSLHKETKDFGGTNSIPKGMQLAVRKLKVSYASNKLRHKLHPQSGPEELYREPGKG